jgi:uracil-DNA glycosylase
VDGFGHRWRLTNERRVKARESISEINKEIVECRACPRLVEWRERVAREKVARFSQQDYWGRPVPGFGDPLATLIVVGLAPAAHGGNRTGRIFTGDRSGDWLFASMHRTGWASQPTSVARDDGLRLYRAYVAAIVRCAPPANKPTPAERDACMAYHLRELVALTTLKVIVALGSFAWDNSLRAQAAITGERVVPRPKFGHLAECVLGERVLIGSFHPSQQNTFTGKLTEPMLDAVFDRARELAG